MSMGTDIVGYIESNTSLTAGTTLYLNQMPDSAMDVVSVYEQGGLSPDFHYSQPAPSVEKPRLQVLVRSATYVIGESLAREVWSLLTAIMDQTINGRYFQTVMAVDTPTFLERDKNDAAIFTMNFQVWHT